MSNLQKLVNSIIQVFIDYYQSTKSQDNKYDYEKMASMPLPELMETLDNLIKEVTAGSSSRGPLLHYLKFVLEKVKPLVDKDTPLDTEEINIVKDMMVSLIDNCNNLIKSSQKHQLLIQYNNMSVFLEGFRSYRSLSRVGQAIKNRLLVFFNLPKEKENDDYKSIKQAIIDLVEDHQSPLVSKQLKESTLQLEQREQKLMARIGELELNETHLKQELEKMKNKVGALKKENTGLSERVEALTIHNSEQQKKIWELTKKNNESCSTIEHLRTENSNLRNNSNPPQSEKWSLASSPLTGHYNRNKNLFSFTKAADPAAFDILFSPPSKGNGNT